MTVPSVSRWVVEVVATGVLVECGGACVEWWGVGEELVGIGNPKYDLPLRPRKGCLNTNMSYKMAKVC